MAAPKPITLTPVAAEPGVEPQPFGLVGGIPASADVTALTPLAADADLAAVRTKVNAIISALQSSESSD